MAVAVLFPGLASAALPQNVVASKAAASESELSVDINQTSLPAYMETNARYGIMSVGDMPKAGFLSPTNRNYAADLNISQLTAPVPVVPLKENALSTTFINAFVGVSQNMSAFTGSNFMMQFVPTTASTVKRLSSGYVYANGGAFYADGMYYCTYYVQNSSTGAITSVYNRIYNAKTWVMTKSTSVLSTKGLSTVAICASYDVVTEKAYGQFYTKEGNGLVFASIDKNFEVTEIASVPQGANWLTCAFDGKGNLYATQANGNLLKVSLTDGKTTLVGNTGLVTPFNTSGTIDSRSGAYYMVIIKADAANNPISTGVYSVNTATAKATHIYDFDGIVQLNGMFVADPIAEDGAPATVTDITFNYPEGTLNGAIEFNAPATTYDGEAAKGTVNYYVVFNKDTIANGSAEYGAKVSVPYEFPSAGKKTVSVTAYNSVGVGPSVSATSGWLGADNPKNPTNFKLKEENGKILLSWKPVTETKNLGYIDASKVTYTVSMTAPSAVTLAEALTDTCYVYTPADPNEFKTYSFRVVAKYNNLNSTTTSASITIGRITPPYNMEFKNAASLNGYTVIDANEDNTTWKYQSYGAAILYQNKRASDDYLITPGMILEGGKSYVISFQARGWDAKSIEKFEVLFGDAPTVEGLTQNLSDTVTFCSTTFIPYEFSVKPEKSGVYYFAFHGISPNIDDKGYLISQAVYINYLSISAPIDDLAPAAPELDVVPDTYGALTSTVN
ncbi:MAG: fibronectin type III domain-containing protein, partial [Muribaculaceae bacterium]|nr:fibronectin type III domain-containing protein [Muribaculaceae bacterium]